jgi:hypothetical protein
MGPDERRGHPSAMDSPHTQTQAQPAIRAFRICVDRPGRYQTILGVVRRTASDPAMLERSSRRAQPMPRRPVSIFG